MMTAMPDAPAAEDTLDRLAIGSSGVVTAVAGDEHERRRLLEMGLVPGTLVAVLRRAPLGDPIELRVRGYLLSVRADHARHVSLRPATPT
jgi:Fe2+ transport system protein FeoA